MTTFVYTWNATFLAQPGDTDDEAQGAQRIRDTKAAVGERVAVDHSLNGDANDGKHLWSTFRSSGQTTAYVLDAGDGRLWAAADPVTGTTELFWQNSSGVVLQLTSIGFPQPTAGPTALRPSPVKAGTQYYDETLTIPVWWTGGAWVNAQGVAV